MNYFNKWGITTNGNPEKKYIKLKNFSDILFSGIFSFIGILSIVLIEYHTDFLLVVASFGASAVLIYDSIESPLAQPRNVIGGHCISALVGVSCYKLFMLSEGKFFYLPLVASLSVSASIMAMEITKTLHPPGSATALLAVIGPKSIIDLGYMYVLHPILSGASLMLLIAIITNNLVESRRYPMYWI